MVGFKPTNGCSRPLRLDQAPRRNTGWIECHASAPSDAALGLAPSHQAAGEALQQPDVRTAQSVKASNRQPEPLPKKKEIEVTRHNITDQGRNSRSHGTQRGDKNHQENDVDATGDK